MSDKEIEKTIKLSSFLIRRERWGGGEQNLHNQVYVKE